MKKEDGREGERGGEEGRIWSEGRKGEGMNEAGERKEERVEMSEGMNEEGRWERRKGGGEGGEDME